MGKIYKSITVLKHDFLDESMLDNLDDEEVEVEPIPSYRTEYDINGKILKEISYTHDGEIEQITINKYNDKGFLIEEILYAGDEEEIIEHISYELHDDGRIKKRLTHYQEGADDILEHIYNADGLLKEKVMTDNESEISPKEIFEYNRGLLIKESEYNGEGKLIKESTYEYDSKGNIIEEAKWDTYDNQKITYKYQYLDNGNRKQTMVYNHEGQLVEKTVFVEDTLGNLISMSEETPYGTKTTNFVYDERKNLLQQIETNSAGDINSRVERVYNADNQVIESSVFIDRHGTGADQHYILKYVCEEF